MQTKTLTVVRFFQGTSLTVTDSVAVEQPLNLDLIYGSLYNRNVHRLTTMMRTPGDDPSLATGLLFSLGIIKDVDDICDMSVCIRSKLQSDATERLTVSLAPACSFSPTTYLINLPRTSSCGICSIYSPPRADLQVDDTTDPIRVSFATLASLPKKLSSKQSIFQATGGVHAAAMFTAHGDLISVFEDVGRHNALDKLIGHLLRIKHQFSNSILVLSSRASFELLEKAAMAQIPMVAVMGAVSNMAINVAHQCGITLIGFLKEDRLNVYTHGERI